MRRGRQAVANCASQALSGQLFNRARGTAQNLRGTAANRRVEFPGGYSARSSMAPLVVAVAAALATGCAKDEPLIPPTPLSAIERTVAASTQWSVSVGKRDKKNVASFRPVSVNGVVYAAGIDGRVTAVDADTGAVQWQTRVQSSLRSGVAADEARVVVANREGQLTALDSTSGESLWTYDMSSEVLSAVATGFGVVVARGADGRIVGLDGATGTERWTRTYTPPALTVYGYSPPVLLPTGVLLGLDDGKVIALSLENGRTLWESRLTVATGRSEIERLVDIDSNILLDDSFIYAVGYQGNVARLEPQRGNQLWSTALSSTVGMTQSEAALYVTEETDRVVAVNKDDGETLWEQTALVGRKLTRPVLINGALVVIDFEGIVHVLDTATGELEGRLDTGAEGIGSQPLVVDGKLLIQFPDGKLRQIKTQSLKREAGTEESA